MSDYKRGSDWRLDLLTTYRSLTTSNYSAIANLHILQITTAHAKPSQSAFTSRFLVTDLNNGDSSASVLTSLLSGEYPTTEFIVTIVLNITSRHGPRRKHCLQHFLYCCVWIRCRGNMFVCECVTQ
jgi:hypothetical protein